MEDKKIKHLEMIQSIITRMNQNSFMLKGWMITIVSALLAIYADKGNTTYIFVALVPILIFWFFDAYYLQQERKFRGLYNDIVDGKDIPSFKMPISIYDKKMDCKFSYCNVFWSPTIAGLYCTLFLLLLLGGLFLAFKDCICITFIC